MFSLWEASPDGLPPKKDEILKRCLLSETSDEDEIGIEHIGMDSTFQDGVFDGVGDTAADAEIG